MKDYTQQINNYLETEIEIIRNLDIKAISDAINLLECARLSGGTVYVFGNGGSASTASHFQNDFNKGVSEQIEAKYRVICLNDNVATIMAIANDNGFENVFRQQLENKLTENDVVVAISGSGNSKNIIKAVEYAKEKGNKVIGFTGYSGGKLKELSDVSLHADIANMQITEDIHVIFNHVMMYTLFNDLVVNRKNE